MERIRANELELLALAHQGLTASPYLVHLNNSNCATAVKKRRGPSKVSSPLHIGQQWQMS